jgi:hypothetical protein
VDKDEWKSFLRWHDQASARELRGRRQRIVEVLKDIRGRDVRCDAHRMVRLIDEELLARESRALRRSAARKRSRSA